MIVSKQKPTNKTLWPLPTTTTNRGSPKEHRGPVLCPWLNQSCHSWSTSLNWQMRKLNYSVFPNSLSWQVSQADFSKVKRTGLQNSQTLINLCFHARRTEAQGTQQTQNKAVVIRCLHLRSIFTALNMRKLEPGRLTDLLKMTQPRNLEHSRTWRVLFTWRHGLRVKIET